MSHRERERVSAEINIVYTAYIILRYGKAATVEGTVDILNLKNLQICEMRWHESMFRVQLKPLSCY